MPCLAPASKHDRPSPARLAMAGGAASDEPTAVPPRRLPRFAQGAQKAPMCSLTVKNAALRTAASSVENTYRGNRQDARLSAGLPTR